MSGHSKWANIKNRKGAQDKKRSMAFTKAAKMILTAIRQGGGRTDPEANSYLKTAIDKAREVNMPKENIDRLLRSFEERKANLATYVFEAFGPFGVPILIEMETDNKNRAIGEVKSLLREYEANLGESGSVSFLFDKVGEIELEKIPSEEQQLELIDLGATDIDGSTVVVESTRLHEATERLKEKGYQIKNAELVMRSKAPVMLTDEEALNKVLDLVESLEDNEEVINVWSGFDYAQKT